MEVPIVIQAKPGSERENGSQHKRERVLFTTRIFSLGNTDLLGLRGITG